MKNLLFKIKAHFLLYSSVTLAIRLLGKFNSETFRSFETLIGKMARLTVKDIYSKLL